MVKGVLRYSCFQSWQAVFRGTHETIFHFFVTAKTSKIFLLRRQSNKRFAEVYTLLPCLPRLFFCGLVHQSRMEIAPACDGANLIGEVMHNDKTPIS